MTEYVPVNECWYLNVSAMSYAQVRKEILVHLGFSSPGTYHTYDLSTQTIHSAQYLQNVCLRSPPALLMAWAACVEEGPS